MLCFRKFRVSKNFVPKRGISRFSIENLLSHGTENFAGELFFVSQNKISGIEKNYGQEVWEGREGGSITVFCQFFLSHSAEKFRRRTLQCVTNFGYRKILCFRELCHDFVLKIFCHTVPKNFVEEPF